MTYRSNCQCYCHDGLVVMHIVPCCEPDPETAPGTIEAMYPGFVDQIADAVAIGHLAIPGPTRLKTLIEIGTHMTLMLPRLSRLSDERDQRMASDLVARWDEAFHKQGR
jgi:hypothetical protein